MEYRLTGEKEGSPAQSVAVQQQRGLCIASTLAAVQASIKMYVAGHAECEASG